MEKSKISGKIEGGKQKDTVIKNFEQVDGKLIMQGGEEGRGWSMVIQRVQENCRQPSLETRPDLSYLAPAQRFKVILRSSVILSSQ